MFRIFCKRVAASEYPGEPTGLRFNGPCEGEPIPEGATVRFQALLKRRAEVVAALDQVFGRAQAGTGFSVGQFGEATADAPAELDSFLSDLIPFYDDEVETLPSSTRALAAVLERLVAESAGDQPDSRATAVLNKLAEISGRQGYRRADQALAAVHPMLSYDRMDELSQTLLTMIGEGGEAHDTFVQLLRVSALELAEAGEDKPLKDTTLRVATRLLLGPDYRDVNADGVVDEHDLAEEAAADPLWLVRRVDESGAAALSHGAPAYSVPRPWEVVGGCPSSAEQEPQPDGGMDGEPGAGSGAQRLEVQRPFQVPGYCDWNGTWTADGRAIDDNGLFAYRYFDANSTVLAALLREQKPLIERKQSGQPATAEKLLRGARVLLGEPVMRTESFRVDTEGRERKYVFEGFDVEHGPLFDLVHAGATLLRYPETADVLALLETLIRDYESEASGPVYAGLRIDERADDPIHDGAFIAGYDGTPDTPHEFWDDLIQIGQRMLLREPGLIEAVLRAFAGPSGDANGELMALFMKYKDSVTYDGAPISVGADGRFSEEAARRMNQRIVHEHAQEVDRSTPGYDRGMNRSLFQRLISTINATNGAPNCNKDGAKLHVNSNGAELDLPRAAPEQGYGACDFVKQPNGTEAHMRSILGRTRAFPQDPDLPVIAKIVAQAEGLTALEYIGRTQEHDSQIEGFTLTPTPESIARLIYAPKNQWLGDLFGPMPTVHDVPLVDYEPNLLFSLEVRHPSVTVDGQPVSFLEASAPLLQAFDDHELFTEQPHPEYKPDGQDADPIEELANVDGYLFADLLSALHRHWASPRDSGCEPPLSPDTAGCTQSFDPDAPFYSHQSNLVSYEPLLIEAILEEDLTGVLARAQSMFEAIDIGGKNGFQVLAAFVERMLTPDPDIAYRDGRTFAATNTCVPTTEGGRPACACPELTVEVEGACVMCPAGTQLNVRGECSGPGGTLPRRVVPRGRIVADGNGIPPIYLVLDALKGFDEAFEQHPERLGAWREARSELVDHLLTVARRKDGDGRVQYVMVNQRGRAIALSLLPWLRGVIRDHSEDLVAWTEGLAERLASVLGHPLAARGLDLFDHVWDHPEVGDELARLNTYLMDAEGHPEAFRGVVLAAADTLELVDKDPGLTPLVQFASLLIADNAFEALEDNRELPDVENGTAYRLLEVTRKIADLDRGHPAPSTIAKLLKNLVLPQASGDRAPLEVIFDAVADVNRLVPENPRHIPMTFPDNREIFRQLAEFLSDEDRGLERLYSVIQNRSL